MKHALDRQFVKYRQNLVNLLQTGELIRKEGGSFDVDHNLNDCAIKYIHYQTNLINSYAKTYGQEVVVMVDGTHGLYQYNFISVPWVTIYCLGNTSMVRISTFFSVSIDDLKHYAVIFVLKEGKIKLVTFRELKMILILSTMRLILKAMIAIQILTLN